MSGETTSLVRSAQRWLLATPLVVAVACGGPQSLGGAGAECFRDDECQPGLICVAPTEEDINRVCSNDPTPLISNVEGPPVMMMGGGAGAAGMAGAMPVAGAGGMGAMGGGGAAAGSAGSSGSSGSAGMGGSDSAGSGGSGGSGGTAGSGGAAGTGGSGGTDPEGGAPN